MTRSDRSYDQPRYPLYRVHMAVALRCVEITKKALGEARTVLPGGTVHVSSEIASIVGSLDEAQFRFSQKRAGEWVDVYQVETEVASVWIKLKLETNPHTGEELVVISFHEWDHSPPD